MTEANTEGVKPVQVKVIERYWAKVTKHQDGCWSWLGCHSKAGYALFTIRRRNVLAHRFAFEQANGPIPDGLFVDHMCRNKGCINPAHLRAVDPRTNACENNDGVIALNAAKQFCHKGHPFDEENTRYLKNGGRVCRICHRERGRRHDKRRRGSGNG